VLGKPRASQHSRTFGDFLKSQEYPRFGGTGAPRRLLRWFAFWGSSGAGNEVPHAFLSLRIVEGIVQVLWSASGGVMEKHVLTASGPLENRVNKTSPHPRSRA
jgi:hypothetical protein